MGGGNPPDKYIAVTLTGVLDIDLAAINTAADQGYRAVCLLPDDKGHLPSMLMGNYGGNS